MDPWTLCAVMKGQEASAQDTKEENIFISYWRNLPRKLWNRAISAHISNANITNDGEIPKRIR